MSKKGVDHQGGDQGICPTCGSDDPRYGNATYHRPPDHCPDPWHNPDSPPPETPGQREQGRQWTIWICATTGDPYTCSCPDEYNREGELLDCRDEAIEVVPLSDTNHLRERAESAEREAAGILEIADRNLRTAGTWKARAEKAESQLARIREWAEGNLADAEKMHDSLPEDTYAAQAQRFLIVTYRACLSLLNTEESK